MASPTNLSICLSSGKRGGHGTVVVTGIGQSTGVVQSAGRLGVRVQGQVVELTLKLKSYYNVV